MRPSSSSIDIIPTKFLKEVLPAISPCLLTIINQSLFSDCVPDYFKTASVSPLHEKPFLDTSNLANYRPIYKLPFISKVLEKVVAHQLLRLVEGHSITDKFQCGFLQKNNTETALLKVASDILMLEDNTEFSILVL